jgi:hypothetical protein
MDTATLEAISILINNAIDGLSEKLAVRFDEINTRILILEKDSLTPNPSYQTPFPVGREMGRRETINTLLGPNFNSDAVSPVLPSPVIDPQTRSAITTFVQEQEVPEKQKMHHPTAKSFQFANDNLRIAKAQTSGAAKKLIHYIGTEIQKKAVDNEIFLGTSNSTLLNYHSVFLLSDGDVTKMICRLIRPISFQEYAQALKNSITPFEPVHSTYALAVRGWSSNMFTPVNKLLNELKEYDALFRTAATDNELSRLPPLEWGRKEAPGAFRLMMACFGSFSSSIVSHIGEKALSQAKTLEDFLKLIRNINETLRDISLQVDYHEAKFKPPERLLTIFTDKPTTAAGPDRNTNLSTPMSTVLPAVNAVSDEVNAVSDDSIHQIHIDIPNTSADIDDDIDEDVELDMLAIGAPPRLAQKHKSDPKTLPCFTVLDGAKCTDAKCPYSHDRVVLTKYIESKRAKLDKMMSNISH